MTPSGVQRALRYLAMRQRGDAVAAGPWRWTMTIRNFIDLEAGLVEGGVPITFNESVEVAEGKVGALSCDAQLDQLSKSSRALVAEFQAEVAKALRREAVQFADTSSLWAWLQAELGARPGRGAALWVQRGEDAPRIVIMSYPQELAEPWIEMSTTFRESAESLADWLVRRDLLMPGARLSVLPDGAALLSAAFPLEHLTGQRVLELLSQLEDELDGLEGEWDDDFGEGDDGEPSEGGDADS